MNKSLRRASIAVGAACLAAACATSEAVIPSRDNMLVAAGFVPKSANSPSRLAALRSLPPHKFVSRNRNGRLTYLYADPSVCACVYVGGQEAYDHYRQNVTARKNVGDQQIRAILSTSPLPGEAGL